MDRNHVFKEHNHGHIIYTHSYTHTHTHHTYMQVIAYTYNKGPRFSDNSNSTPSIRVDPFKTPEGSTFLSFEFCKIIKTAAIINNNNNNNNK